MSDGGDGGGGLGLYGTLSRLPRPRTYVGKIMALAFLGTHVPLLVLVGYFVLGSPLPEGEQLQILGVALAATLIGTVATLYTLRSLLTPILAASRALRRYREEGTLPTLPDDYADEAGRLMADADTTIRQLDELLEHTRSHDAVTGLPNRELFREIVERALSDGGGDRDAGEAGSRVAVLKVRLDGYQRAASALGPEAGARLLRRSADRLRAAAAGAHGLARLDGPVFAVCRAGDGAVRDLATHLQRLRVALSRALETEDTTVHLEPIVGVAVSPDDGDGAHELLRSAGAALSTARERDEDVRLFSAEQAEALRHDLELESTLRKALEREEFVLHYQPCLDLESGRTVLSEALIRWDHGGQLVSPGEFIPVTERIGLISDVGLWVLREACARARTWSAGSGGPGVAVNVSTEQFRDSDLVADVEETLASTGLAPERLTLEITESLLLDDADRHLRTLERLRGLGVRIAVDDFGTGFSSLAYLRHLPVDQLKIDRSFVSGLGVRSEDEAVVDGVIQMAGRLGMEVVGEGVESAEQAEQLRRRGCDLAQGFHFRRPVPPEELDADGRESSTASGGSEAG